RLVLDLANKKVVQEQPIKINPANGVNLNCDYKEVKLVENIDLKPQSSTVVAYKLDADFLNNNQSWAQNQTQQMLFVSQGGKVPGGIIEYPRPKTIRNVRAFLGVVNFYRMHIPECATIQKPLSRLMGKKVLEWSDKCEKAFFNLKKLLLNPKLLAYPNYDSRESL
ncbi:unnamed protein product, partial [Rotaria magnacalcarata]